MTALHASGFPFDEVRARALHGASAVFPDASSYGTSLFGAGSASSADLLEQARLVPPVFVPRRLEKLIELGREPLYGDVALSTSIGGFASALPLYLSAFGSTQVAGRGLGAAASAQAARLGIPMVIGENVVPMHGHGRVDGASAGTLLERLRAYADAVPDGLGGVVVQQSTEDADAEVWNLVYSDPSALPLLESGRLAFELKVGQGAKPGLGGMTLVSSADAASLASQYAVDLSLGSQVLRSSSPGTFTDEILRQQIRLMRNNFPRAGAWVKLPPGRDIGSAASVAWAAGASAVTVDGAEGGSGWAPVSFASVGLPLAECLSRIGTPAGCLLASGRMWEGTRVAKVLALGARAAGLGRAALLAVDTDPSDGLVRFVEALALELRLLLSALGQYRADALTPDDVWFPGQTERVAEEVLS